MKPARTWLGLMAACSWLAAAGAAAAETNEVLQRVVALEQAAAQLDATLTRQLNEVSWHQRLADVAVMDKLRFTGPPPRVAAGPGAPGASNEVVFSALTFLPRPLPAGKIPLVVFAHGEVHGNMATDEEAVIVRELLGLGYAVVAPDYRGSSGYGTEFWRQIDYGGLEIEDVDAARRGMLARYERLDPGRVGIIGWSHGGLIAMMTVIAHPDAYKACYAGVPVSDLEERMKYLGPGYEAMFSAPYHLGKSLAEAPDEYHRRSPAWNVGGLRTPLLIHAAANDEEVRLVEIERLIQALKQAGKPFEYHCYTNAPGGHLFNRIDTPLARESRAEIWRFLGGYLHPESR